MRFGQIGRKFTWEKGREEEKQKELRLMVRTINCFRHFVKYFNRVPNFIWRQKSSF